MSKSLSGHFRGTGGAAGSGLGRYLGIDPDEPTATVWRHIEPTQPNYPGTEIPRSFIVSTPNGKFFTHGNATKHMNEVVTSVKDTPLLKGTNPKLYSQFILYDYRKALTAATKNGVPFRTRVKRGDWEFRFSKRKGDKHTVVIHAVFKGFR